MTITSSSRLFRLGPILQNRPQTVEELWGYLQRIDRAFRDIELSIESIGRIEEGTWTPVIGGSGGTSGQTYSFAAGTYTRRGNNVSVQFDVELSVKGVITANLQLQGLPFTSAAQVFIPITFWRNLATPVIAIVGVINAAVDAATLDMITAATTDVSTAMATADVTNTTRFGGSFSYMAE